MFDVFWRERRVIREQNNAFVKASMSRESFACRSLPQTASHCAHPTRSTYAARARHASSWSTDLPSLRELRAAAALPEADLIKKTDEALTRCDKLMTSLRTSMPFERAAQEASARWKAELNEVFGEAMAARDARLLEAVAGGNDKDWRLGFRRAQRLGLLHPPWLHFDGPRAEFFTAAQQLASGLEATQHKRQYTLQQACVREVSEARKMQTVVGPSRFQLDAARRVVGAADVALSLIHI